MLGRSLRNRVFFALTLLSLLPLVSTAYQGYHCGRMVVMDLLRHHAISVAEARQAMITQWIEERTQDTEAIASVPLVTTCLEKILGNAMRPRLKSWETPFAPSSLWEEVTSTWQYSIRHGDRWHPLEMAIIPTRRLPSPNSKRMCAMRPAYISVGFTGTVKATWARTLEG